MKRSVTECSQVHKNAVGTKLIVVKIEKTRESGREPFYIFYCWVCFSNFFDVTAFAVSSLPVPFHPNRPYREDNIRE